MTKIRVALADDHPAILAGLRYELENQPSLAVVGTARNSTAIVESILRAPCDVLVTDYAMPGGRYGDGMTLLGYLHRTFPKLRVVVLTSIENPALLRQIGASGIRAVLNKTGDLHHLIAAIHAVYLGHEFRCPASGPRPASSTTGKPLSKRESEVLRLYVSGVSITGIAARLHRTKQTISAQKVSAMKKLGLECDADLYGFAFRAGLSTAALSNASGIDGHLEP